MQIRKRILKIVLAVVMLVIGLTIAGSIAAFAYRNNADFHHMIFSQVFDTDVRSEGVLNIEMVSGRLQAKFEDWKIRDDEKQNKPVILSVESGTLAYNLFSLIGIGTSIPAIDLKNLRYDTGEDIKPVKITHVTKAGENIDVKGQIGDVSITGKIDADNKTMNLTLSDLNLSAEYGSGFSDLDKITVKKADKSLNGSYHKRGKKHALGLDFENNNSLNILYKSRDDKQRVKVSSPSFNLSDVSTIRFFVDEITSLSKRLTVKNKAEDDDEGEKDNDLRVDINIAKLDALGKDAGHIKALLTQDSSGLLFDPKDVAVADGRVKGKVFISSVSKGQTVIDIDWKNYNFGLFRSMLGQESKSIGKGSLRADLKAQGGTTQVLKETLTGSINVDLKDGRIGAGLINFWGGGVVNSLMPSFKENADQADLNCARVYVQLENGQGRVKPVLLDTSKVTLYGKGELNLPNDTINIVIKPSSKGIAIGDISSAVRVSGKLSNPSFSLDTMSALKKLGSIALGTVNPAFFLFSLGDVGLDQEDVCAK